MKSIIPVVTLALVSLAGCSARTQSARFVQAAPAPETQPVTFFSTRVPTCPYEELGIVRGYADTGFTKLQTVLDDMADEARRMGGHAIVGISQSHSADGDDGERVRGNGLFGTVIRFTSPDCTT